MIYIFRMFGVRDLIIAVDLVRRPQQRGRLQREGVAVHGIDTGAALPAAALGQLPWRHGLLVAGISFTNTVLAGVGARGYRGHPGAPHHSGRPSALALWPRPRETSLTRPVPGDCP